MPPLISVIIPVYNHARALGRSLKSLVAQTHRPLEVIVVNDGSTESFTTPPSSWAANIPFQVINQPHQGASAARNRGFAEARGEFVIFWDADTMARPEMLDKLKRQLEASPEAAYAYSQFRFGWKKMKSQPFSAKVLKQYNYIDTTSLIRRSDLAGMAGPFDEFLTRFQDWDLWLTLLRLNKTGVFVPEVLYTKIVQWGGGISRWRPSWFYQIFPQNSVVKKYREAKEAVLIRHGLK